MAVIDLIHPDVVHHISIEPLVAKCRRFIANRLLTGETDHVQSLVAADAVLPSPPLSQTMRSISLRELRRAIAAVR
jgi:hypothetical protein